MRGAPRPGSYLRLCHVSQSVSCHFLTRTFQMLCVACAQQGQASSQQVSLRWGWLAC